MSVIYAFKFTNFTDFCNKLLKNLYDCNFTLNLVEKKKKKEEKNLVKKKSKHIVILQDQNFMVFLHI